MDAISPLVPLLALPAAHRRRPPRRPEDTLPPEIALKPPHRRTVARSVAKVGKIANVNEDARGRALKDIEERQESLEKLKENLEIFTESGEECKSLLTNLTDGLEKFLGFNSTSKGYTGTGIVYSDLDRLCDGVMSFLHGVLQTVKDDENVTKYNEYIKLNGDNDLHTVLQHLQSSIGQGRSVFGAQVEKVNSLSTGVTHELGQLNDMYIHNEINSVSGTASKDLTTQLEEWKKTLGKISTELTNIETYNINILDRSLKSRLMHEIKPVQKSVEVLADAANDATFGEQVNMVDETLKIQLANVEQDIRDKSVDCQRMLKNAFWMVLGRIDILSEQQRKEFKDILNLFSRKVQLVDLVQKAQAEFGTLKEKVDGSDKSSPPSAGVIANWDGLKVHINQIVGGLTATNDIRAGTLKDIVNGVIEYATGFEKDAFTEDVLKQWIGEMVKESDTVVSNKIKAVQAIEAVLKSGDQATRTDTYLTETIKAILKSFANRFKQYAAELKRFVTVSKLHPNLEEAIKKVNEIGQEFENNKGKYGQYITAALTIVKQKINALDEIVKESDGTLTNAVNELDTVIGEIKKLIKESESKTDDGEINKRKKDVEKKMEDLKGQLNSRIKDVELGHSSRQTIPAGCSWKSNDAVETLKNSLLARAGDAFRRVRDEIQKLFADGHKADLTALQKLVTKQTTEIKNIIHEDEMTGIKGLLKSANGMLFGINGEGILKFRQPKTTLLDALKTAVPTEAVTDKNYATKFSESSDALKSYLDQLLQYTELQVKFEGDHRSPTKESQLVSSIKTRLDTLLDYLIKITNEKDKERKYAFDHKSTRYLTELNDSISALSPSSFHGFHNPLLLDALKAGMDKFTEQLGHAYVNKYSGMKFNGDLLEDKKDAETKKPSPTEKVLSTEGRNCAKVCLTILERVSYDFYKVRKTRSTLGAKWENHKLILGNDLGEFFRKHGFEVSKDGDTQDGELKGDKTGKELYDLLVKNDEKHVYKVEDNKTDTGPMRALHKHLKDYYRVCQVRHIPNARAPTTIFGMMQWLVGLQWHPMIKKLEGQLKELFDKPQGQEETDYKEINADKLELPATTPFTAKQLHDTLDDMCYHSEKMLITILGHGHPDGRYAVDFNTNADDLLYPNRASACLDMLTDILNRLFSQLYFLLTQCSHNTDYSGWSNCSYGQGVGNSGWQCNDNLCPNQQCNLRPNQNADQAPNQKCNQHPKCGVKSPLQSYLEDSLPGFLPHTFSNVGCGVKCSVGNHFGKPCLTPMGFTDISVKASHTKEGTYLQKVLEKFCGKAESPLTKLCSQLNCLSPTAPKTLGDMFSFYHNFLNEWNTKTEHKRDAFAAAVNKANFEKRYKNFDPAIMFGSPKHSHKQMNADLGSLVCNSRTTQTCGPYLQSINHDVIGTFSKNHAAKYLSWIVYATETFYDLLKKLYDDCCGTCGGDYPKCRVARGQHTCHIANQQGSDNDSDTCTSIVRCQHTRPTIYTYGFVHHDVVSLAGQRRRTCRDFCDALNKVLNKEEQMGATLAELIYKTIPEFLFRIREPFIWTLLALWSLSLLYLLHIAVVRLDVLRIRSHLRSPASHRIAAQSLLAAARVRALANVKYFSP
ncbi:hypothetical protein, conserved [Babesia ovata]|uniref:Extracellular matrix-binding ebh n=1 Tax=Babesia ovata TaxID=189622 RepID=A0A2H6KKD2_9APIC|nr:uncharacterized protein BOVATA_049460 [Babesia ovata]GBE63453.1 hypothetical protein, conserved [Babesia ovata]